MNGNQSMASSEETSMDTTEKTLLDELKKISENLGEQIREQTNDISQLNMENERIRNSLFDLSSSLQSDIEIPMNELLETERTISMDMLKLKEKDGQAFVDNLRNNCLKIAEITGGWNSSMTEMEKTFEKIRNARANLEDSVNFLLRKVAEMKEANEIEEPLLAKVIAKDNTKKNLVEEAKKISHDLQKLKQERATTIGHLQAEAKNFELALQQLSSGAEIMEKLLQLEKDGYLQLKKVIESMISRCNAI